MIITTLEELRLHLPANAIDNIESMTGFIEASEYDVLRDKLGKPLYKLLTAYYSDLEAQDIDTFITSIQTNQELNPYARLLFLAQRVVAFDAIGNAVGAHVVSINGAGINVASADDYAVADDKKIEKFQSTCRTECHKAINLLLETLEDWVKDSASSTSGSVLSGTAAESSSSVLSSSADELTEITTAWKQSQYFFLAAGMIIPSAQILQQYLNIYDNREKFILMLPDIRYIHEEVLAQAVGEDLMDYLADVAVKGTTDKTLARIINRLRKAMAAHLEARTQVLKVDKERRVAAHNEAINLTDQAVEYISVNHASLPADAQQAYKTSPLYTPEVSTTESREPRFVNNRKGNAMFVTPALR